MFKRLLISLLAVGLVAIFTAEAADAATGRYRRSVENFHECGSGENCYGAESVQDILYGFDGTNAICNMTGRVFCDPLDNGEICSDADTNAALTTASFSAEATFDVDSALDLTVLDQQTGQGVCNDEYGVDSDGEPLTRFSKFWPNVFVAHSIYTDADTTFPNVGGDEDTYELIELCTIQTDDPQYSCVIIWDSTSTDPPPKLPCCGEVNTLTVDIVPDGGGTVTSDDSEIVDCPDICSATYDGTLSPYDGCPEVTLTATPETGLSGYTFTGWNGGGCEEFGTDPCTTSAKGSPTVTANFEASYHTLTVIVNGDGEKDRAYIWDPRSDFDDPAQTYCYGTCYKQFAPGETVILKRKGGTWDSWSGFDCAGTPNNLDTCEITMDASYTVEANFIN